MDSNNSSFINLDACIENSAGKIPDNDIEKEDPGKEDGPLMSHY